MTTQSMEESMNARVENRAEDFYRKYRPQMEALEKDSMLAKVRASRGMQPMDYYGLGMQLEQFETYRKFLEEDGNTNVLGKLPNVALDVITAVHGSSVMPIISSIQPIEEEQGIVYFKNIRAEDSRGNITALDTLSDPRSLPKTGSGYASNKVENEVADTTAAATVDYTFTLAAKPLKSESLRIDVQDDPATYAIDVGPAPGASGAAQQVGRLLGVGLSGSVNYITGAVTIKFAEQPAEPKSIFASYQENLELAADLPEIQSFFDSKPVKARVYALKGTIGMLQSYAAQKRFGMVMQDMLAQDLVQEINKEIGGDAIKKLYANAVGTTEFDRTVPDASISFTEHKQLYKDRLADAEAVMQLNAGRGTASVIIAGRTQASLIQTLPGFQKLADGSVLGPHVFGTLDGVTVIRVNEAAILGPEEGIVLWKGLSPFEAACVWSPYMPLTVTEVMPLSPNPLSSQRAAAVWAAQESLVPQYATRLNLITS